MRIYEVTYCVDGTHSYLSQILAENTRQIPALLAELHGEGKAIALEILKVRDTDVPAILTNTLIESGFHDLLMGLPLLLDGTNNS